MKSRDFEKTLLIQALTISFLVHICLGLSTLVLPTIPPPDRRPIEVEILSQNENSQKQRQFVTDPNTQSVDEKLENLKDQADLLSRLTQRVKKQQIANKTGPTQNAKAQNAKESAKSNPLAERARQDLSNRSGSIVDERPSITAPMPDSSRRSSDLATKVGNGVAIGDSTISDYIPEVSQGGFTSLNTDQFVYYTFFARVNEQVRNRWINNIRYAIQKEFTARDMASLSRSEQISEVEIVLSKDGQFVTAIVHRKADDEVLDNAAAFAFRNAAPFLNPPVELAGEDGLIHLHYQFHLRLNSRYYAGDAPR